MIQILYIGNNLRQANANVSVMATLGPLLEGEGYQLYYASSKKHKLGRLLDMIVSVLRYAHKVEVVLIDTYSTQNFYYALFISQLCRFLKLPYIPILHGGNLSNRLITNPKMSSMIFKHALWNVAPSKYQKEQFQDQGYTNLYYIPNTVEIGNYTFITPGHFDTIQLLWVRSFSKIYNPLLAIKVLRQLKDLGYDAGLCMIGPDSDGTLQDAKELAHTLDVEVRFTGKLTKQEWIAVSKDYNVFINTTNIDNMPVSVVEAMALGLPIVSTNVGGMPYLIEHGTHGLLVEPNNIDAMVKEILRLFEHPEKRDEMILNARNLAKSFDWQEVKFAWRTVLASS